MAKAGLFLASGTAGGVIGWAVTLTLIACLLEVSTSAFFTIIFGVSLIFLGGAVMWRVLATQGDDAEHSKRIAVMTFAVFVLLSGLFCFLLDKNWIPDMSTGLKIPMYSVLGISLTFSVVYTFVELMNMGACSFCCKRTTPQPVVGTPLQVFLILAASVLIGLIYGCLFAIIDVEDDDDVTHERLGRIFNDSWIGGVIGAVSGLLNEYLRQRDQGDDYDVLRGGTYNDALF